jgi:hypothetical protein
MWRKCKNASKILFGKVQNGRPIERFWKGWEDNLRMDCREMMYIVEWFSWLR